MRQANAVAPKEPHPHGDRVEAFERNVSSDMISNGMMLATTDGFVIGVHVEHRRCLEWVALTARGAYRHATWEEFLMVEFELFDDALFAALMWSTRTVPLGDAALAPSGGRWDVGERDAEIRLIEVERAGLQAIQGALDMGLFEHTPKKPTRLPDPALEPPPEGTGVATVSDDIFRRMQEDLATVLSSRG